MFETPWIAALAALFLWWFATGILLWRVHAADRSDSPDAHLWSVMLALPLLLGGAFGIRETLGDPSPQGVFIAFLSALALWGWVELAFLSGVIAGPNTAPCPPGLAGARRFSQALGTILWHELLLAGIFAALIWGAANAPNPFGMWTWALLFGARISAKLNLFFGVPRINTDFLPRPLIHLAGYFRKGPISAFFPFSVTLLSFTIGCFIERLWRADADPGAVIGWTLLTALASLALLEHWFMVWRVPDDKLWRWMIPATRGPKKSLQEDPNGL